MSSASPTMIPSSAAEGPVVTAFSVLHATDMPFYDSRINVAGWVLLAGLRCAIAGRGEAPPTEADQQAAGG